jgi:hypothetical protein
MKQLIQSYKTGELGLFEVPPPICGENGLLVRTTASLVSSNHCDQRYLVTTALRYTEVMSQGKFVRHHSYGNIRDEKKAACPLFPFSTTDHNFHNWQLTGLTRT